MLGAESKAVLPYAHELRRFHLNPEGLSAERGSRTRKTVLSPQTTGADSGEYCIIWLGPEFPGDQRRDDAGSLTFDSAPLANDMDLVGFPVRVVAGKKGLEQGQVELSLRRDRVKLAAPVGEAVAKARELLEKA